MGLGDGLGEGLGLGLGDMILAEQELTIQVRHFNVVVVSAVDSTFWSATQSHQRESLDVLTTEGTSANHKGVDISEFFLNFSSQNLNLVIISAIHRLSVYLTFGYDLKDLVVEPLLERRVLASVFDKFLSNNTTEESALRHQGALSELSRFSDTHVV